MDAARRSVSSWIGRFRGALTPARAGAPAPGAPCAPSTERASSPPAATASPVAASASSPPAPTSPPAALRGSATLLVSAPASPLASAPPDCPDPHDGDGGCSDGVLQSRNSADLGDSKTERAGAPEGRGRRHSTNPIRRVGMKRSSDDGKLATRKRARFAAGGCSGGRDSETGDEAEGRVGQLGLGFYSIFRDVERAAVAMLSTRVLSPQSSHTKGTAAVGTAQDSVIVAAVEDASNGEKGDTAFNAFACELARTATAAGKDLLTDTPPQPMALRHEHDRPDALGDQAAVECADSRRELLDGSVPLPAVLDGARDGAAPSRACGADILNDEDGQGRPEALGTGSGGSGSDSSMLSSCKLSELSDAASSPNSSHTGDLETGERPGFRRRRGPPPLAQTWEQGVQYQNMSPVDLGAACRRYAGEEAAAGRPIVAPLPEWSRCVAIPIEGQHLRVVANRRRKRVFRESLAARRRRSAAAGGGSATTDVIHRSSMPGQGMPPVG